jgi:hypothetical protein
MTPSPEPIVSSTQSVAVLGKRHLVSKILIGCGLVILLLILFLFLAPRFLGYVYTDTAVVDDSDLLLPVLTIAGDQNAFADLQNAGTALYKVKSATSTVNEKETATTQVLTSLRAAAQKPFYQDPHTVNPSRLTITTDLPPLNQFRNAAQFNAIYAENLAATGKQKDALTQALTDVSIGNKMIDSRSPLLEWLVGLSVQNIGLNAIQNIATSSAPSSKDLVATARVLNLYQGTDSGLVNVFKLEYMSLSKGSMLNADPNFYWHPNETRGYFITNARQQIELANKSCSTFSDSTALKGRYVPSNPVMRFFTPNIIGMTLYDLVSISGINVKGKECDTQTLLNATQLILGLTAYQEDHHQLPVALTDLVPTYLLVLPPDPYSGKPFIYDQKRSLFYSVGRTHTDIGGNPYSKNDPVPNPTFILNP